MIDLRRIMLKIFSLMCVFMFMVGPVCAAELIGKEPIGTVDLSKETYKSLTTDSKGTGLISVKDTAAQMSYYDIKQTDSGISISKEEAAGKSTVTTMRVHNSVITGLKGYNGELFAVLHKADDGSITVTKYYTSDVLAGEYVEIPVEFSEVILSGFTGIKQTTFNDVNLTTAANLTFPGTFDAVTVAVDGYSGEYRAFDDTNISTYPTTSGLVAAYPFASNANDVSGNAKHGTPTGITFTGGKAVSQDGALIDIPSTGIVATSNYTVVANVVPYNNIAASQILTLYAGTNDRVTVSMGSGYIVFAEYTGTYNRKSGAVVNNTEYLIIGTGSGGALTARFNGVAVTGTAAATASTSSRLLRNFIGESKYIIIYNNTLPTASIRAFEYGFSGLAFQPASTWIGYSGTTTSLGAGTFNYIDIVDTNGGTYDVVVTGYFTEDTTLISDLTTIMYNNISIVHGPGRNYTDGTITYPRASGYPSYPLLESNNTGASLTTNATHYIINTGDLTVGDMFIYNLSSYSGTETWAVSGNVYEDDGITPVSGAVVTIGTATDTTDAAGYYYFPEIINGTTYQATFSKTQYDTATLSFTVDGADVVNPDVTMHWINEDQAQRRNMISLFMAIGGMLGAGLLIGAAVVFYKSISGKSEVSFKQIRELGFAAIFLVIFLLAVVMMGAAVYR